MNSDDDVKEKVSHLLDDMRPILNEMKKPESRAGNIKRLTEIARTIADLVETRDPHKVGHQLRVADLAKTMGTDMNLQSDQIEGILLAGMLHDIGKINIPRDILNKPVKLMVEEYQIVTTHVQAGYDLLKDLDFPWTVARIVLEHHEKWNGSGYPNGRKGDNILLEARIIAVADVVDAFATTRSYRPALEIDAALYYLSGNRGSLYDSEVVKACLRLFNEKGYKMLEVD
jgi:putative nucleotidyltransferase with HDIG domain